ncbi:uncharacterized protein LOC120671003 [Panicum virgatum]|uniref:uncharacterized protein LOC120671003 n=1 Tax=Panicum virgatum TaxID=38727 RepID=UPI0019D686B3|nr:uncharacterized protein LOC120671003 [Panicum virgatum]
MRFLSASCLFLISHVQELNFIFKTLFPSLFSYAQIDLAGCCNRDRVHMQLAVSALGVVGAVMNLTAGAGPMVWISIIWEDWLEHLVLCLLLFRCHGAPRQDWLGIRGFEVDTMISIDSAIFWQHPSSPLEV